MRRSFSIRALMASILLAGAGFTALRSASVASFRFVYTLTALMLLGAIVAARYGRRSSRAFWFGFAVFGWGYWLLAFGVWPPDSESSWLRSVPSGLNPSLVTTGWIDALAERLAPAPDPAPPPPRASNYRGGYVRIAGGGWAIERTHCTTLLLHLFLCLLMAVTGGVFARVAAASSRATLGEAGGRTPNPSLQRTRPAAAPFGSIDGGSGGPVR